MNNKETYQKAYKNAMQDVEAQLSASLKRNGNTIHGTITSLNELILYLHEEISQPTHKSNVEIVVENAIDELNAVFNLALQAKGAR